MVALAKSLNATTLTYLMKYEVKQKREYVLIYNKPQHTINVLFYCPLLSEPTVYEISLCLHSTIYKTTAKQYFLYGLF